MPWASTALSVGSSLLGGAFGGGNKKAERRARDATARAQFAQEAAQAAGQSRLSPFIEAGTNATERLSYLLGTGGYGAPRPTFENEYNKLKDTVGQGFYQKGIRNTNHTQYITGAQRNYETALADWQKKFDAAKPAGADSEFGSLNRNFTNEDFVKDPGYIARLLEGELGEKRNLISRGAGDSGQALKELERYRQTYASNEFGNAYNRDASNKSRTYNQLLGVSNQGLNAAGTSIGVSTNAANNIGNIGINQANQQLQIGQNNADNQSNAFQSAIGNLIYGINRNNTNAGRTPDFNPYGGSSKIPFAQQFL
jgi:hypothetical protein